MALSDMQATPVISQKDRPYVAFETRAEEDTRASAKEGRMVFIDQHYARITPPGSRDVHYEKLPGWFAKLDMNVRTGRVMPEWVDQWKAAYEKYKHGQEIPLDGTPIRGWTMITGAQQENLIALNILTVEDLATLPSEGMSRIGMGALELRRRAEAWLMQKQGAEPVAVKMTALQRENDTLKETVQSLTEKVEELSRAVDAKQKRGKSAE